MIYSKTDLVGLYKNQLQDLCALMKHSTDGNKDDLVQRILDHQAELPPDHAKLIRDKNYVMQHVRQPVEKAKTTPTRRSWLEELQDELRLSNFTVNALADNNFSAKQDLQLLTSDVMKDLNLPIRDQLTIAKNIAQEKNSTGILAIDVNQTGKRNVLFDDPVFKQAVQPLALTRRDRSHSHSSSSGEDFVVDIGAAKLLNFPACARDLERPYLFVCPKQDARGVYKKATQFSISIDDFFCGKLPNRTAFVSISDTPGSTVGMF